MEPLPLTEERETIPRSLSRVASRFEHAPRDMLRTHSLQRRTDTKFLIHSEGIVLLLASVANDYLLLPPEESLFARYSTVYFDTPDFLCFNEHRRGRRPRYKIRTRHYLDRQRTFLEIKTKRANRTTDKFRQERRFGDDTLTLEDREEITRRTGWPADDLQPSLEMNYSRLTLFGKKSAERMTLDFQVSFMNGGAQYHLHQAAIVEVKQTQLCRVTPIMRALQARGSRPGSVSKYCMALALLRPEVRANHIRPALRALERLHP